MPNDSEKDNVEDFIMGWQRTEYIAFEEADIESGS